MKAVKTLRDEHQYILRMLKVVKSLCIHTFNTKEVYYKGYHDAIDFIRNYADKFHHGKEEDILFKVMSSQLGPAIEKGPIFGMLAEHDLGRLFLDVIIMLTNTGTQTIVTERLILRKFTYEDSDAMLKYWIADEKIQSLYSEPVYTTKKAVKELLDKYISFLIYFLFIGMTLALMTSSGYCIIDLRISSTISLEEGELNLDRLKMEIAGKFFRVDSSIILNYRQK